METSDPIVGDATEMRREARNVMVNDYLDIEGIG